MFESRSKSLHNRELAREALYKCVRQHRAQGLKTAAALEHVAPIVGITGRKARSLFFNENIGPMSDAERHGIRMGVVRAGRRLAAQLRELADQIDAEATTEEQSEGALWQSDISPGPAA